MLSKQEQALQEHKRDNKCDRFPFVISYNPTQLSIQKILHNKQPLLHSSDSRDREVGEGGGGHVLPPQYFKNFKQSVRKVSRAPLNIESLMCPPPPPPLLRIIQTC